MVIVSVFLLFGAACGDGDEASETTAPAPAATEAAAPETTMAEEPVMVDDEPIKLGYISGGDADPFV
ncbi:MAG: hypothetical protein OXS29_09250, partial [bacterium]|nr:hypothetical protein [bacterium]MDE0440084.1 hypothetical protein [bacterium]